MLVSKALLSAVVATSKDDTRPVLQSVKVYREDDHIISVATDGYILAEVAQSTPDISEFPQLPNGIEPAAVDEVMIPASVVKRLLASMKNDSGLPVLDLALLQSETVTTTNLKETTTLSFKQPDDNYPEYRKLIEKNDMREYHSSLVNPKYLKQILAMFKDDYSVELSISSDRNAPIYIQSSADGVKKKALIMPLRG